MSRSAAASFVSFSLVLVACGPEGSPTAPTGLRARIAPAEWARSPSATLVLEASDAAEVSVSGDVSAVEGEASRAGAFIPFATSLAVTLTEKEGPKTVWVSFRSGEGAVSGPVTAQTTLDTQPPEGSLRLVPLASGASQVLLVVEASDAVSGVARLRVADTAEGLASAAFRPFSNALPWTLPAGSGTRTVHVQLEDRAGNATPLEQPLSASIVLDGQAQPGAPTELRAELSAAPFTRTTAVTLSLSGRGATEVKVSGDVVSVDGGAADTFIPWRETLPLVLTSGDGLKRVSVVARNAAGVESASVLAVTALDASPPTGTASILGPADRGLVSASVTASRLVQLDVQASDVGSGVVELRVAADAADLGAAPWQSVARSLSWRLDGAEGPASLALQVRDGVGNESAPISAQTVLDLSPPTAPTLVQVASAVSQANLTLGLQAPSIDALSAPVRYEAIAEGQASWQALVFPASVPLAVNQRNLVRVRAVDGAGNASPETWLSVMHDDAAPAAPSIQVPALVVNASTAPVALVEAVDSSFDHFETCTASVSVSARCPVTCTFASSQSAFALSLSPEVKTCLLARAVDAAGNVSPTASAAIVSDLSPPTAPRLSPAGDFSRVEVHAATVPLHFTAPAWDSPLGSAAEPWVGIRHLEVDEGRGFTPVCPLAGSEGTGWNPCGASMSPCFDARLRCRGPLLSGLELGTSPGRSRLAVRAVDLAGNTSPAEEVQFEVPQGRVVLTDAAEKRQLDVFGSTLVHSRRVGADDQLDLIELGADMQLGPSDTSCAVETDASALHRQGSLGRPGVVYTKLAAATHALRLRRRGADERFCSLDDPAPVSLITMPTTLEVQSTGLSELHAFVASIDPASPACGMVRLREAGFNDVLGDGDDVSFTLTVPYEPAHGTADVQLGDRGLLIRRGGCGGTPANTWVLLRATPRSFFSTTTAGTFTAERAALSADGRTLAFVSSGSVTVRRAGADGQLFTADDRVVARSPNGTVGPGSLLAVEDGRVVLTQTDVSTGTRSFWEWSAGPDDQFESAALGDDEVADFESALDEPSDLAITRGRLFWSRRSNLFTADRRARRWELLARETIAFPAVPEAGVLLVQVDDGGETELRATYADGVERDSSLGLTFGTGRAFVASGKNLLVAGFDPTTSAQELRAVHAGADGHFFTADDVSRTVATSSTESFFPLAARDGKALLARGAGAGNDLTAFVLDPGPSATWSSASAALVNLGGGLFSDRLGGAVTASYAAWIQNVGGIRRIIVRGAGSDGRFGTADDPAAVTLMRQPTAPTTPHETSWVDVALDGTRLAFVASSGPSTSVLNVVEAGADRVFNTADDALTAVPLPFAWSGTLESRLAFGGGVLRFTARDEAGLERVFSYDAATRALTRVTTHDSRKHQLTTSPTGRVFWMDHVFTTPAVFSAQ